MPKNNNETTTKFKVDISELKKGITEANRQIRLANAQFKSASSGMDDWSKSTEGVEAKLKQLETVLGNENKKLQSLEKQLQLTANEFGENSAQADELRIKIANQQATINRTTSDISKYRDVLKKLGDESEDTGEALEDVKKSAEKAGDGFTIMKGAIASLIADGLKSLATSVKDTMSEIVLETGKAYDSFQAKTGTATESMDEFRDVMNDLYKNNYGDSLDDVANAMAEIKQQTKETDPSKLKELTENALALRDTFDFDVKESMRAVNMLMQQFGISGEEAYNLIVQGAQQGLDKNGDLLDTVNEYSVHYKQLGYTSEEFFNSLINGAKSGTFSVDKLGDAMKEFGIRSKDTAVATTEGFELIGLNADEMRESFAKGGEEAKKATEKTLKALLNLDDQVIQNQAGVDLFGTMWEDLGIEGVKALMNTNGELKKTTKSMEDLKNIKYDNVKSKLEQLGRTVKMDLLAPLAEKLVPKVEKFVDYCIKNSDKIVKALKVIGTTIATVFVVNKVATFISSISTMVTTFKTLTTAIKGAQVAQTLLNATSMAFPAVAIAVGIGGIVTALISMGDNTESVKEKWAKLTEEEQKNVDKINELSESYRKSREAVDESVANTQAQFSYYDSLRTELDGLVDANGRVKSGYEERVQFILTTLNNALGTEMSLTDGVIGKYGEQKQALIDLMNTKKAQIILQANEQAYTDAINNQTTAFNNLSSVQTSVKKTQDELAIAKKELAEIQSKSYEEWSAENDILGSVDYKIGKYQIAVATAKEKVEGLEEKQKEFNEKLIESEDTWVGYNATIKNYEGLSSAIISGDTSKINQALNNMVNNFITAETGNKRSLEKQVEDMKTNYNNLKKAVEAGAPAVTQEMVTTAKEMVDKSYAELNKLETKGKDAGEKGGEGVTKGIKSKKKDVKDAGEEVAKEGVKGIESVDTEDSGTNFLDGFIKGLSATSAIAKLSKAVKGVGKQIVGWFNDSLGEQSPSKITKQSGKYFLDGFGNGLDSNMSKIGNKVKDVASGFVSDFNVGLNAPNVNIAKSGLVGSNLTSGSTGSATQVTNNYNFNQTNNSPKALSRLEIYRQTKNQFNYATGGNV